MIDNMDDRAKRSSDAKEAAEKRLRDRNAIEKFFGRKLQGEEKYSVSGVQAEELARNGYLALDFEFDAGASHKSIVELLKKHPVLRATGRHAGGGQLALDGFDVRGEWFQNDVLRDFFDFAIKHADDFIVSREHLFMWFD